MAPARKIPVPAPSFFLAGAITTAYGWRAEHRLPLVSAVVTIIVVIEIEQLE
jgi:hypothetical protein